MPFLPVGGQAVIEGVMMRSPSRVAVAVRRADGSLAFKEWVFTSLTRKVRVLGLPVVRGAVSLFETLWLGFSALNFSADEAAREDSAAGAPTPSVPRGSARASRGASRSALAGAAQSLVLLLGVALGVLLFVVLPARLTSALGIQGRVAWGLVDGLFRLAFFLGYLMLISQWREMRRVLGYHGAEHKAIHALENGALLTPEHVQRFSRFHPRCGTSFLFLVVVVSIFVFTAIGRPHSLGGHLARIAAMPLIAGVAFEFIRLAGRFPHSPWLVGIIWPGLQFQKLTTREPELSMCEVALAALERVRGDEALVAAALPEAQRSSLAFIQ